MKLNEIIELTQAKVVAGNTKENHDLQKAFSSDLMSDVLTIQQDNLLLITGLVNLQSIRTAEMSDIPCVIFVRNKRIDNKIINALALPGGQIIVFSGLLEAVKSENELAFVLAHEISHYANRDHLRGIGRSLIFMSIGTTLFHSSNFIRDRLGSWLQISELAFSRKQESAADAYALNLLNCQQGNAKGAISFLEITSKMDQQSFGGHYFSSHPDNKERISALTELAQERGIALK